MSVLIKHQKYEEFGHLVEKIIHDLRINLESRSTVKIWAYLRHSPGTGQSIESQEMIIDDFCEKFDDVIIDKKFIDEAKKGSTTVGRTGFNNMVYLSRQKPKTADMILLWDFGRFGRGASDSQFYRAEMIRNGWHLFSLKDDIPKGPMQHLYLAMIDWKNEQFLIDLKAGTMRGQRLLAEKGFQPTGKKPPVGYKFILVPHSTTKNGEPKYGRKPVIDQELRVGVLAAFELKVQKVSNKIIREETGLCPHFKNSQWSRFFRDRRYTGEYEFQGELFSNIYPPIISKELFWAVQETLPKKKPPSQIRHHPRRKGSTFFLATSSFCSYCSSPMEGKSLKPNVNGKRYRYYVCSKQNNANRLKKFTEANNEKFIECTGNSKVPADFIEEEMINVFLNQILSIEYMQDLVAWTNQQLGQGVEGLELQLQQNKRAYDSEKQSLDTYELSLLNLGDTTGLVRHRLTQKVEAQAEKVERLHKAVRGIENRLENNRLVATQKQIETYITFQRDRLKLKKFGNLFDLQEAFVQAGIKIVMSQEECQVHLHFPSL